jgi:hypothetical protein
MKQEADIGLLHADLLFGFAVCFVSCLAYSSALKMAALFLPNRLLSFAGLHGVVCQQFENRVLRTYEVLSNAENECRSSAYIKELLGGGGGGGEQACLLLCVTNHNG